MYFTALYEKCDTTGQMKDAVKMVDSCTRENGVLCNVARSWLLFLHDESEWKNLNKILLEMMMNCTKHFDLSSSLMASCVARFMIC